MKRTRKTKYKGFLIALGVLVAAIVLVEWIAPLFILKSLNKKLNKNPQFQNYVGGLDINILSGGYTLKDFEIRRLRGDSSLPIFTAKSIDVSLKWRALLSGRRTGEISLEEPALYFVEQFRKQKKKPKPLDKILARFYPFPIDFLRIQEGAIHYQDFGEDVPIHVFVDKLDGEARGLAALRSTDSSERRASVWITGRAMGKAPLKIDMALVPGAPYPDLDLKMTLGDLQLTTFNGLFRAYAQLDVETGTVGFSSHIEARGGRFHGILRPRLRDLKILDSKNDKGVVQKVWEAVADAAAKFLEKENRVKPTSERAISGSFTHPGQDAWKALGALLTGTFAQSLDPRLGKAVPPQEGISWDVLKPE